MICCNGLSIHQRGVKLGERLAPTLLAGARQMFGETTEVFAVTYEVAPAPMPAGRYRQISGNLALAYGLIAAQTAAPPSRAISAATKPMRTNVGSIPHDPGGSPEHIE